MFIFVFCSILINHGKLLIIIVLIHESLLILWYGDYCLDDKKGISEACARSTLHINIINLYSFKKDREIFVCEVIECNNILALKLGARMATYKIPLLVFNLEFE